MIKLLAFIYIQLGWFFCEAAFRTDDDKWWGTLYWYLVGTWTYPMGNWFYKRGMQIEEKYGFISKCWKLP